MESVNGFQNNQSQEYLDNLCNLQLKKTNFSRLPNDSSFCPATHDGWSCWNDTPAGHLAYTACPDFITGFDPNRFAHKLCLPDGTWFRHPKTNKTWSNYTSCVDMDDYLLRKRINGYYIIGYSISVAALVISMGIFLFFKSLRCTRITIHMNLFLSFIINNCVWITWYATIYDPDLLWGNKISCQVFHVVLQYFLVCNYFWMFCEGLYLHTILVVAFINADIILKWFYVIGWFLPGILTGIYGVVRGSFSEHTVICWIDWSPFLFILKVPVCISIAVNFFFLINIVRVLITKMRAVNSPDINQTKKAVRATLILIPLLGLHYLMMPFRPDPGSPGEDIYQTVSAIVTSLQGLCVACLFCFFNGEVLSVITKKWHQTRLFRNRSYSVAATSITFVPRMKSMDQQQERM